MSGKGTKRKLYNLHEIRNIPILDVCDALGLNVEKRGRNYWCKVRPEKNASVILHEDSNFFYDFGNQRKGGVIDLVSYASGRDTGESIEFLAGQFNIEPSQTEEDLLRAPLSDWEYRCIGLYGDMASKNISFPIAFASAEVLGDIAYFFRIPMNQLREEYPKAYEFILETRAIPYVDQLRNKYYCEVWNHYDLLRTFGKGHLFFDSERTETKFKERAHVLERAERYLHKAVQNTSLEIPKPQSYNPLRVLSHILQGKISISLGNVNSKELNDEALAVGCGIQSVELTYDDYHSVDMSSFLHSAEFDGNFVYIEYLEKDAADLEILFGALEEKSSLDHLIKCAECKVKQDENSNVVREKDFVH